MEIQINWASLERACQHNRDYRISVQLGLVIITDSVFDFEGTVLLIAYNKFVHKKHMPGTTDG